MKKWKIYLFSLILLLLSFVAIRSIPAEEVDVSASSTTHSVVFDYNMQDLSKNLYPEIRTIGNYTVDVESGGYASHTLSSSDSEKLSSILGAYTLEWYVGTLKVTPSSYAIYADTTFEAKWIPIIFTISFQHNDSEAYPVKEKIEPIQYTVELEHDINFTYRNIPERDHYYFVSWCDAPTLKDSDLYMFTPAGSIGSFTLYARWSPVEYPINYHTDADNTRNPTSYNVEDGNITLYAPSKEGHIFKGWYWDEKLTQSTSTIASGSTGEVNLYPKWELETYKVTYILPDGTRASVMCEYGKTAPLPDELEKSIFEIVKTDVSRDNITKDVRINITLVNIWYVYVLGLALIVGIIVLIIVVKKKREKSFENLRTTYQSNSSRFAKTKRSNYATRNNRRKY